jgi:UTP--glucose-1-phosphate uridylyltransferase
MKQRVTKAVIAAAGFGTRFLPQTKAMPKEMLPIVDKPVIQYIVEELVEAGITDIIIVTSAAKHSIEAHFDAPAADLAAALSKNKPELLEELWGITNMANFTYVRQKEPLGNAAPLLCARHLLRGEPFIYSFGDDILCASPNHFQQMVAQYEKAHASVLPCIELTDDEAYRRYGIVGGEVQPDGCIKMRTIAEKPGKAAAPSNLASAGGYLLTPEIVDYVKDAAAKPDRQGELMIAAALQAMIDDGHPCYAFKVAGGTYYDTGNKLEYVKAVVDFALARDDIGPELKAYLQHKFS